ncbi:MAG: DUF2147 domain-containing protein [Saprospiraceae bacterium]|nr:DUF2147 domain-containing protein [Saprospiraceae bacterium]
MKQLLLALCCCTLACLAQGQSLTGNWKTIDDDTGEAKSHVQIYEQNGQLAGKVVKLLKSAPDRKCDKCPGERKDKPVLGMVILENLRLQDGYWQSGRILDPEKGKWYTCSMWLKDGDPNVLVVRGYIGPFFRTQNWYRIP